MPTHMNRDACQGKTATDWAWPAHHALPYPKLCAAACWRAALPAPALAAAAAPANNLPPIAGVHQVDRSNEAGAETHVVPLLPCTLLVVRCEGIQ